MSLNDNYRPAVEIGDGIEGDGLFAAETISKGQLIVEYTGERISDAESERRGGRYLFEVKKNLVIDGSHPSHTARYINHACTPNAEAEHEVTEDRVYIRAARKIRPGEEITIDYGEEYMNDIIIPDGGCRCADCVAR
jgi:SET domain-containing protein